MSKLALISVLLASTASLSSGGPGASSDAASYSFREPPLNSMGVKSLAELRGKPVLIDFWGRN